MTARALTPRPVTGPDASGRIPAGRVCLDEMQALAAYLVSLKWRRGTGSASRQQLEPRHEEEYR
jgi:hypothetical protein